MEWTGKVDIKKVEFPAAGEICNCSGKFPDEATLISASVASTTGFQNTTSLSNQNTTLVVQSEHHSRCPTRTPLSLSSQNTTFVVQPEHHSRCPVRAPLSKQKNHLTNTDKKIHEQPPGDINLFKNSELSCFLWSVICYDGEKNALFHMSRPRSFSWRKTQNDKADVI